MSRYLFMMMPDKKKYFFEEKAKRFPHLTQEQYESEEYARFIYEMIGRKVLLPVALHKGGEISEELCKRLSQKGIQIFEERPEGDEGGEDNG